METLTFIMRELRVNFYDMPESETFKYHYYLKTPAYFYRKAFVAGCEPVEEKLLAVEFTETGVLFLCEERCRKIELEQFINPFEVIEYSLQQLEPKYEEKKQRDEVKCIDKLFNSTN